MTNVKSIYGHENNFPTIKSCHFIHKTWGGVWVVIAISSYIDFLSSAGVEVCCPASAKHD